MTINELAHSAQHLLLASTGTRVKTTHIYELLAATFGFRSYASFRTNTVFAELHVVKRQRCVDGLAVRNRCVELGYQDEVARAVSLTLPHLLAERHIGAIEIAALVTDLRGDWEEDFRNCKVQDSTGSDNFEDGDYDFVDNWAEPADAPYPILLDGLEIQAGKGRALAHYALALLHAPDQDEAREVGSDYWYSQAQQGQVLTGVEKEWADAYAARLERDRKYTHHLREAAKLGQHEAMLDLAKQFGDPTFFEQENPNIDVDPIIVVEIAEQFGRPDDARKWLTKAAESGNTEAMRQLIEEYDHGDLQRCWIWIHLADLLGDDLTKDDFFAIGEDGLPYDDVGGTAYVSGQDGVKLDPISPEQDAAARRAAEQLLIRIQPPSND
ncbi:conserved protein of unknown function [Cupriavidus taiwanensis]|uniref:Uncharacterized protein n=1 Tax=Cupriavidus taiwanensis TaxID=164546 RepID=A0A375IF34_9BURK|nr:sel1 repeat family protein [Cupriavidus taiwanensis]SPK72688.1 conserved protein of unknown function [Cupriavidus taiwanensis]